jgi:hypothetical protein
MATYPASFFPPYTEPMTVSVVPASIVRENQAYFRTD